MTKFKTLLILTFGIHFSFGATFLCNQIPSLTEKQRGICQTTPDIIPVVGYGTQLGIQECQHQFKFSRWNCSTPATEQSFPHLFVVGSREAAYLYGITSSGVTYAITKACSRGEISSCGCAPTSTTPEVNNLSGHHWPAAASSWRWGGCSANVEFGLRFARKFLDAREIEGDARSLMNLHNNKAGRKMVQATLETECKCHGVSGSCTLKTCWLKLPTFREIGNQLVHKYQQARPVLAVQGSPEGQRSRRSLILLLRPKSSNTPRLVGSTPRLRHSPRIKPREKKRSLKDSKSKPRRTELVYLEPSPNYCEADNRIGSLGTRGRQCLQPKINGRHPNQSQVTDRESCAILCCGRGHSTHHLQRRWQCGCKFHWCCQVECENCSETLEIFTCN